MNYLIIEVKLRVNSLKSTIISGAILQRGVPGHELGGVPLCGVRHPRLLGALQIPGQDAPPGAKVGH